MARKPGSMMLPSAFTLLSSPPPRHPPHCRHWNSSTLILPWLASLVVLTLFMASASAEAAYQTSVILENTRGLVAVGPDESIYATDQQSGDVFRIQPSGTITTIMDASGDSSNPNTSPYAVAVGSQGQVIVGALGSDNVFRIRPSGTITEILDATGDGLGNTFGGPASIAIDSLGNVYALSSSSDNVFRISPSGTITEFLDTASSGGLVADPLEVRTDASGNVFVSDGGGFFGDGGVFRITPSGTITLILDGIGAGFAEPRGLAVGPDGSVYVAGLTTHNAFRLTPAGTLTEIIDSAGDGAGNALTSPVHIAVGDDGLIYVVSPSSLFVVETNGTVAKLIETQGNMAWVAVKSFGELFIASHFPNEVIRAAKPACSNGVDDDGDTLIDFPDDPGCTSPDSLTENPLCDDGVDNDGDTFTDFPADPGCASADSATENPACDDGIDNDTDTFTDFPDDTACASGSGTTEVGPCQDGVDNDGDGLTDHPADPGCISPHDLDEREPGVDCDDGLDNDSDTLADFPNDPECTSPFDDSELINCSDGIDNDGDTFTDYPNDPECTSALDSTETADCADNIDNDSDGLADFPVDPGCNSAGDLSERDAALPCDDGIDNDGDTFADYPDDPGCSDPSDPSELSALHCDDGIDNDGDGLTDHPADPGCTSLTDASEVDAGLVCDDGVDNDFDGLADFPADPGCTSVYDTDEREPGIACDDGIDNDGDGDIDFRLTSVTGSDRGCSGPADPDEKSPILPCDDGLDNDLDGQADYPNDPGCSSPRSLNEAPACSDGIDNDGDGFTDLTDVDCSDASDRYESPVACSDGIDNDGDGQIDQADPGCDEFAFSVDFFESSLITTSGGVISGFLCETDSTDCPNTANFAVTSAVLGAGRMEIGGSFYFQEIEASQLTFEGNAGGVARIELTGVSAGGAWQSAFTFPTLLGFNFFGTIELFDAFDISISGPAGFNVSTSDLGSFGGGTISSCTGSSVEAGECSLFLDSFAQGSSYSTLDINGTPHRLVLNLSLLLAGSCGNGVVDPGEACDDGNELSGDCCSAVCELEAFGETCDDGDTCTQVDTCDGNGACQGASPLVCADGNGCTDDSCDPIAGCQFTNNVAPCDDAVFCNGTDTCAGGVCLHAGDPCPGADADGDCAESCDEGAGACTAADPNGSSCSDGLTCTLVDTCSSGLCAAGEPPDCDDADECTADSCDESTGCAHDPILNCPPPYLPTGGRALQMLIVLALVGLGSWRLVSRGRVRD